MKVRQYKFRCPNTTTIVRITQRWGPRDYELTIRCTETIGHTGRHFNVEWKEWWD